MSNPDDGSSKNITSGLPINAKATDNLLFSPPLNFLHYLFLKDSKSSSAIKPLIYFSFSLLDISKKLGS